MQGRKLTTLKKRREFDRIYRQGRKVWNDVFVLYALRGDAATLNETPLGWRYGLTVSKKVGNSVQRSRVKRLIREGIRLSAETIERGWEFIVVARASAVPLKGAEAQALLQSLFARAGMIGRPHQRAKTASAENPAREGQTERGAG